MKSSSCKLYNYKNHSCGLVLSEVSLFLWDKRNVSIDLQVGDPFWFTTILTVYIKEHLYKMRNGSGAVRSCQSASYLWPLQLVFVTFIPMIIWRSHWRTSWLEHTLLFLWFYCNVLLWLWHMAMCNFPTPLPRVLLLIILPWYTGSSVIAKGQRKVQLLRSYAGLITFYYPVAIEFYK